MSRKYNFKIGKVNKNYAIPLLLIAVSFIVAGYFIINLINHFLFQQMSIISNRQAEIHNTRLADSISAYETIDELLKKELIAAKDIVQRHEQYINNEYLINVAETLGIDEIYWYNNENKIIYTNGKYLGWVAEEGHPVNDFIKSGQELFIDEIRKDTEDNRYYRYLYSRSSNAEILQIGISADYIDTLTKNFSTDKFIKQLVGENEISQVIILNNDGEISYSGIEELDDYILNEAEKNAINSNEISGLKTKYNNKDVYETIQPIYISDERVGTLIIFYSLNSIKKLNNQITAIVMVLLILTYIFLSSIFVKIDRKNTEINKLSFLDEVTDLYNKSFFLQTINRVINEKNRSNKGLIIINLTNLNLINIISGQKSVDKLLKDYAQLLKSMLKDNEQIFSYSADNFLILTDNYKSKCELAKISEEIISKMIELSKTIHNSSLVSKKIGIIEIDHNLKDVDTITNYIEITINKLSSLEEESYWFFNENIKEEIIINEIIENELRLAIYNDCEEFYLQYQPQIDLKTGSIIGLEALARWKNKELGQVPPYKFIAIAEKTKLIPILEKWIIKKACEYIKRLEMEGITNLKVAVNISTMHFSQGGFLNTILEIINETNIDPNCLEIEITETHLISNYDDINKKLNKLREMGISIALDDFGTGYSSLAHLKNLNIDILKIDKSFIDYVAKSEKESFFVRNIISFAKELNIKTIAEGVEDTEQKDYLITEDCDVIQGYLFSKPISDDDAIDLIKDTNFNL